MVRFSVEDGAAEVVSSMLWDAGTSGIVEIDDVLLAGFDGRDEAEAVAERAANWPVTVLAVEPNEWAGSDEITEVPFGSGSSDWPEPARTLTIAAGTTFGHGAHPTTALAIDLLTEAIGQRVSAGRTLATLDVGTGSGVLAIAAAALGSDPVVGIDIDPEAIPIARANAARNGVEAVFSDGSIATAGSTVDDRGFDLVVANVLLPVHRELASEMAAVLAPGASLVTTGYLEDDGEVVVELHRMAIEGAGLPAVTVVAEQRRDGWLGHRYEVGG